VVSDRFFDATLAYQGYGHRLDLAALRSITTFATGGLVPDLTFLLDLPAEEGLMRRKKHGEWNRLDAYNLEFHQRVRQGYMELAAAEPRRWIILDARKDAQSLQREVRQLVEARLPKPAG
ncbi:MAG TPA: dTMP kinase, partial [Anaerolineales bacterium]|nr:dTMP kinase [Anaerolineales bacterium]